MSNHRKPLFRMLLESWSLRPSQIRSGRGVMNGLPVWLGPLRLIGCPVEKTVIAVTVHPPSATFVQPSRRSKGICHTALVTARCRVSKVAGPLEQRRQSVT